MKLFCVTLTGADDNTDPAKLLELSRRFPFVEWGILLSEGRAGSGRYPEGKWLRELHDAIYDLPWRPQRGFAAHLCGKTMRKVVSGDDTWGDHHWLSPSNVATMFSRFQLNFSARREGYDEEVLNSLFSRWLYAFAKPMITQEHAGNDGVTEILQDQDQTHYRSYRLHQVLHDASGGRGVAPDVVPQPVAGMLNGYAGGIGPDNVIDRLNAVEAAVGRGYCWIDMENSLRDENDQFDLDRATSVLEQVASEGGKRGWIS